MIDVAVLNRSTRKRLYSTPALRRLAERICAGEQLSVGSEVSLLFCDDEEMAGLNAEYRGKRGATDVLAFEQESPAGLTPRPLGDIVISLETVERRNAGSEEAMRHDVRLLFCHGLLHLLGYDHDSADSQRLMVQKQAEYLGVTEEEAWREARGATGPKRAKAHGMGASE